MMVKTICAKIIEKKTTAKLTISTFIKINNRHYFLCSLDTRHERTFSLRHKMTLKLNLVSVKVTNNAITMNPWVVYSCFTLLTHRAGEAINYIGDKTL